MRIAKSVSRTIRIDQEVNRLLENLAQKERVNVNLLVNKALRRFTEWDSQAERFGFVTIPASVHARFYDYLTEEEARQMGHWAGRNFARDFILFWFKKITLDTVLDALRLLGSEYLRIFQLEFSSSGRTHTIVLKHGRGPKGSVFNEEFLRTVFRELLNISITIDSLEDQVVAHFSTERETASSRARVP